MGAQGPGRGRGLQGQGPWVAIVAHRRRGVGRAGGGRAQGGLRGGRAQPDPFPSLLLFPPPRGPGLASPRRGCGGARWSVVLRWRPGLPGASRGPGVGWSWVVGAPEGLSTRGPSAGVEGSPPGKHRSLRRSLLLAWDRGWEWVSSVSGVVRARIPGWGSGGQRVGAVVDLVLEGRQVM